MNCFASKQRFLTGRLQRRKKSLRFHQQVSCQPHRSYSSSYLAHFSWEEKTSIGFQTTRWLSTTTTSTITTSDVTTATTTTTDVTDVTAAATAATTREEEDESSSSSSSSSSCWVEEVRVLLHDNFPRKAQDVLYQAEQSQRISNEQDKREMAGQIIDSWIQYQDELLEAYYCIDDDDDDDDKDENDGVNRKKNGIDQRRGQLKRICEAAERAHLLLEVMLPFLARNNNTSTISQAYTTTVVKTNTTTASTASLSSSSDAEVRRAARRSFDAAATARCDAVLTAYAKAARAGHSMKQTRLTRAIPQRAQYLLEQMEASYSDNNNNNSSSSNAGSSHQQMAATAAAAGNDDKDKVIVVRPSVESYNRAMEAWAYSHEHLRGSMAERIFQQLSGRTASGSRPNGESFRLIIWAWALSGERRAAFTATGHLMKMLRKLDKGNEDMEPSLEDYKVIFKAWTKAEDKSSPGKAMSVLRLMDHAFGRGTTTVEPDFDCFRYLLLVAAKRPLLPDLGPLVDDVLARMSTRLLVPDTECYEAAIETWKNAALNPDLVDFCDHSVKRVLELLSDMRIASQQSAYVSVKPTTKTINNVIEALSMSSNPRKMDQAEHLLLEMEEALDENRPDATPSANSYKQVINIWMGSKLPEKVPRAKSVLWRMEERYEKLSKGTDTVDDFVGVFNAFIRVCASMEVQNAEKEKEILKEALAAIETMKRYEKLRPNADTFSATLEACDSLLAPGSERAMIIEKVFHLCCEKGMVDDKVLVRLRSAITPDQYYKLVVSASEEIEGQRMVPEAWTYNALGGRVITADGRRTKPLSIEGKLAITKSMLDFRMRRLTDKRNRNLLRGARLSRPSKTGAGTLTSANEL